MSTNTKSLVPQTENDALKIRIGRLENALSEFVGGSNWQPYLNLIRSLPRYSDDIERDFGLEIYDRIRNDDAAGPAMETLVNLCFANDCNIVPAVVANSTSDNDTILEAEEAEKARQFVHAAIAQMEIPFETVLLSIVEDACWEGNKLSEITMMEAEYNGKFVYFVRSLDPKPRQVFRYVVDRNNRLLCILAIIPGIGLVLTEGMVPDPSKYPNTVTPSKFVVLTFPGKNRDPRGASKGRKAYNLWWLKQQAWVGLLTWLTQVAGGFVWGSCPEDAVADPNQPGTVEEQQAAIVAPFLKSGAFVMLKHGGELHVERPQGNGDQWWNSIDGYDRGIFTSILTQAKSNKEAEHASKADSGQGQNLTDAVVRRIQGVVSRTVETQFFFRILQVNFGDEYALKYTPQLMLSAAADEDWAANAQGAGALGVSLTPKQKAQAIETKLNLIPDLQGIMEQEAQNQANADQTAKNTAGNDPGTKNPAKKEVA